VSAIAMGAIAWALGPREAHVATLTDATGRVQVAAAANPDIWRPVSNGDQVRTGQHLRTGPGSSVTMIFFDGSRAALAADSEVTLERVDGGWGKVLQVRIIQAAGSTAHSIIPFGEKGFISSPLREAPRGTSFKAGGSNRRSLVPVDRDCPGPMLAQKCRYPPGAVVAQTRNSSKPTNFLLSRAP
jgi:hypothetical protein